MLGGKIRIFYIMGNDFQVVFQVWFYIFHIYICIILPVKFCIWLEMHEAQRTPQTCHNVFTHLLLSITPPIIQMPSKNSWPCVFKVLWNGPASVFLLKLKPSLNSECFHLSWSFLILPYLGVSLNSIWNSGHWGGDKCLYGCTIYRKTAWERELHRSCLY